MQRPLLSLIICFLSTESTALRHEQHTSAASAAEGGGVSVCLEPVSPSCLNKWAQKGGLAEGAELRSRTVISANGGPLAEWSSGYVTHNEDRLGLRLPQVLFRLNGEKGLWERDACRSIRREGGIPVISIETEKHRPLLLHTYTAFHCRFLIT